FESLDFVVMLARSRSLGEAFGEFAKGRIPARRERGLSGNVNWDLMLRIQNEWYDQMVEAERMPTVTQRQQARKVYIERARKFRTHLLAEGAKGIIGGLGGRLTRDMRTRVIAKVLMAILAPVLGSVTDDWHKAAMRFDLTKLAVALAAYKAEKAGYPKTLAELRATYGKEIPGDRFSGKPLVYRRTGTGYVLYSVGSNGEDDGGKEDEDGDTDDIVVRVGGGKELAE
ncbi:hypothetical protein LCGC14_2695040, partial [marine sediment metagenome]